MRMAKLKKKKKMRTQKKTDHKPDRETDIRLMRQLDYEPDGCNDIRLMIRMDYEPDGCFDIRLIFQPAILRGKNMRTQKGDGL